MIKIEFSGETIADVNAQIMAAMGKNPAASETGSKLKKVTDDSDPEEKEKPTKKETGTKKKEADDEKEVKTDDAALRQAIKANEWPIEKAKAFVKKATGCDSIPDIPVKKRVAFLEKVEEASTWSNKQLDKFISDDEEDL